MKTLNVLALVLVLLCINASTEWPTHTVCKEENLEIYYKSCGEILKISIFHFLLSRQQNCSYTAREVYKPGSEWKGYIPKLALGFAAGMFCLSHIAGLVDTHASKCI